VNETKEISCTLERAQELTGYTRQRLYQAISAGKLKTWKAGRRRMTSPKYLQEMIELDQHASNGGKVAA
jgi:hypothetical protein